MPGRLLDANFTLGYRWCYNDFELWRSFCLTIPLSSDENYNRGVARFIKKLYYERYISTKKKLSLSNSDLAKASMQKLDGDTERCVFKAETNNSSKLLIARIKGREFNGDI